MKYINLVGKVFDFNGLYYYYRNALNDKWEASKNPVKGDTYSASHILSHAFIDGTEYLEFSKPYFVRATDLVEKYPEINEEYEIY